MRSYSKRLESEGLPLPFSFKTDLKHKIFYTFFLGGLGVAFGWFAVMAFSSGDIIQSLIFATLCPVMLLMFAVIIHNTGIVIDDNGVHTPKAYGFFGHSIPWRDILWVVPFGGKTPGIFITTKNEDVSAHKAGHRVLQMMFAGNHPDTVADVLNRIMKKKQGV